MSILPLTQVIRNPHRLRIHSRKRIYDMHILTIRLEPGIVILVNNLILPIETAEHVRYVN